MSNYDTLPEGLPVPEDDGQADHLVGMELPNVELRSTQGRSVALTQLGSGRTVLYAYPMTGKPGVPLPDGWDEIPGARGCTPESCGFRDHFAELQAAGAQNVFGLSNQGTEYQAELAQRIALPFELLSDDEGKLGSALRLPTFVVEGKALYKRLTLVVLDRRIEKVFYPVFPPDKHAEEVLEWLRNHRPF